MRSKEFGGLFAVNEASKVSLYGEEDDHSELIVRLQNQALRAVGLNEDELSSEQDDALGRYLGRPSGKKIDGRSNAMSLDAAEVVDWALPDLLEPFLAGENIVEYEATRQQDEAFAKQATDLANHIWHADNNGALILHDAVKTALIQKNCILKTVWEDDDDEAEEELQGLSVMQAQEISQDPSVEILEQKSEPVNVLSINPELMPAFADGQAYTLKIRRQVRNGTVKIYNVLPENFRVSDRASSIKDAYYCAHVEAKSRSELIDMGFDEEIVMGARDNRRDDEKDTERADLRFYNEDLTDDEHERPTLDQILTLHEEYIQHDGKLLQCFRVGQTLLDDPTEVEEVPFDTWTADRLPGRLAGLSLVDKVSQTQDIKTSLTRQMLDNISLANRPRFEAPQDSIGDKTLQDLLNFRVGGIIRTKKAGMIRPIELPDRSASAMQGIVYFDGVREAQTGITKNGMAVSSEAIDPKSATESRRQDRNEQVRKKLMIRLIADTLLVPVFGKILKNICRYQDFSRSVRIASEWQEIDPRSWNPSMRAAAGVGLGHTNREEDLAAAQVIMGWQMQGVEGGLVKPQHLYRAFGKLVEAVGWRFPELYALDPDSDEAKEQQAQKQQQPDPAQQEMQQKMQLKMAEMQMDAKRDELKAQRDVQVEMLKAQARQAIEKERLDFDHKSEMSRINQEYELGMERLEAEIMLKQQQMAAELNLKRQQMALMAQSGQGAMRPVRLGGAIG